MKKLAASLVLALALPGLALAAKPPVPGAAQKKTQETKKARAAHSGHVKNPKVLYVLKGTLAAYTAADGTTGGSVSILVKHANHHGAVLKTQTLTFAVSAKTKIVQHDGAPVAVDDMGVVKVRGPKKVAAGDDLATVLQAITARQVIDRGAAS